MSVMLLNHDILIDFPIYPEFPSIPQNSPESTGFEVERQKLSMMSENLPNWLPLLQEAMLRILVWTCSDQSGQVWTDQNSIKIHIIVL